MTTTIQEKRIISLSVNSKDLERASRTLNKSIGQLNKRAKGLNSQFIVLGKQAANFRNIILGYASIDISRRLISGLAGAGDAFVDLTNKIAASEQVAGLQARSLRELQENAASVRSEIEPYADLYTRILRASEGVVDSEKEVARATELVAKSFKAAGATASEYNSGVLQLGQALSSGVLNGEELRAIRENAPLLAKAIADGFGVGVGGLKKLGAEGELTSRRVINAILAAGPQIEATFNTTVAKPTDQIRLAFDKLQLSVGSFVAQSRAVSVAGEALAGSFVFIADNLDTIIPLAGAAAAGILAIGATSVIRSLSLTVASLGGVRNALIAVGLAAKSNAFTLLISGAVAAGVAIYSLTNTTKNLNSSIEGAKTAVSNYNNSVSKIQGNTQQLTALKTQLSEAIASQKPLIEANLRVDIEALNKRIEGNKELQKVYKAQARAKLEDTRDSLKRLESDALKGLTVDINTEGVKGFSFKDRLQGLRYVKRATLSNYEAEIKLISARQDAGEKLGETERERLSVYAKILEARQKAASLEKIINQTFDKKPPLGDSGKPPLALITALDIVRDNIDTLKGKVIDIDFNIAGEGSTAADSVISTFNKRKEVAQSYYDASLKASNDNNISTEQLQSEHNARLFSIESSKNASLKDLQENAERNLANLRANIQGNSLKGQLSRLEIEFNDRKAALDQLKEEEIAIATARGESVASVNEGFRQAELENEQSFQDAKRELAKEAGRISLEDAATLSQGFSAQFDTMQQNSRDAMVDFGVSIAGVLGPNGSLETGLTNAITKSLLFGESFTESLKGLGRAILTEIVGSLVKVGVQMALNAALSKVLGASAKKATTSQASAAAKAWATPAALASLATSGSNAGPATLGLVGVVAASNALAAIPKFAKGGYVSGEGTGTSDSIPALLSNGEFVNTAKTVQYFGRDTFERMNRMAENGGGAGVEKFSKGGLVGGSTSSVPQTVNNTSTPNINITINMPTDIQSQTPHNRRQAGDVGRAVEGAVLKVLQEQMRVGGILRAS